MFIATAAIFTRSMPEQDGAPGDMFKGFGFTALLCFIATFTVGLAIYMICLETEAEVEDEDKAFATRLASKSVAGVTRASRAISGAVRRVFGRGDGDVEEPGVELNDLAIESAFPEQQDVSAMTENPMRAGELPTAAEAALAEAPAGRAASSSVFEMSNPMAAARRPAAAAETRGATPTADRVADRLGQRVHVHKGHRVSIHKAPPPGADLA